MVLFILFGWFMILRYICESGVVLLKIKIFQKGFNFSQDGPGNRLVYHLQGCNMHCPWCSNPEGMEIGGCNVTRDGKTVLSCTEIDTADILSEIDRSQMMFFDGGGVTFTGGEATLQFNELKYLLLELKARGIGTALETNATSQRLPELFGLVDYLITDIKHYNSHMHREITGTGNEAILANIIAASQIRQQLLVRIPLIGGFNSAPEDAQGFSAVLAPAKQKCLIEVLRYHEYGKDKWAQCGMEYTVHDAAITDEAFSSFCSVLKSNCFILTRT